MLPMMNVFREVILYKVLEKNGLSDAQVKMIRGIILLDKTNGPVDERRFYDQLFLKYCLDFHPDVLFNSVSEEVRKKIVEEGNKVYQHENVLKIKALPKKARRMLKNELQQSGILKLTKTIDKNTLIPENVLQKKLAEDKCKSRISQLNSRFEKLQSLPQEMRNQDFGDFRESTTIEELAEKFEETTVSTDQASGDSPEDVQGEEEKVEKILEEVNKELGEIMSDENPDDEGGKASLEDAKKKVLEVVESVVKEKMSLKAETARLQAEIENHNEEIKQIRQRIFKYEALLGIYMFNRYPDYFLTLLSNEERDAINANVLNALKTDFAVALDKYESLPEQIKSEIFRMSRISNVNRVEMLNNLEFCINIERSAEMRELSKVM